MPLCWIIDECIRITCWTTDLRHRRQLGRGYRSLLGREQLEGRGAGGHYKHVSKIPTVRKIHDVDLKDLVAQKAKEEAQDEVLRLSALGIRFCRRI